LQEGTWGGWWFWDSSEFLILLLLYLYILLTHFSFRLSAVIGLLSYSNVLVAAFILLFKVNQLGFVTNFHTFLSERVDYVGSFRSPSLSSAFILVCVLLNLRTWLGYVVAPSRYEHSGVSGLRVAVRYALWLLVVVVFLKQGLYPLTLLVFQINAYTLLPLYYLFRYNYVVTTHLALLIVPTLVLLNTLFDLKFIGVYSLVHLYTELPQVYNFISNPIHVSLFGIYFNKLTKFVLLQNHFLFINDDSCFTLLFDYGWFLYYFNTLNNFLFITLV
jgi:hypothetical protein